MSGEEGTTRCQDQRAKRWHNKRMRKKGYNLENKKLMNTQAARLAEQEKLQENGKDHHESLTLRHMVSSRSNDKGNILR